MKSGSDDILDMNKKRDLRDTEQAPIQSGSEAEDGRRASHERSVTIFARDGGLNHRVSDDMGWDVDIMLKLKKEVREDSAAARETSRRQKDW
jgi:hypothetical protein